jgi:hypothetical protein
MTATFGRGRSFRVYGEYVEPKSNTHQKSYDFPRQRCITSSHEDLAMRTPLLSKMEVRPPAAGHGSVPLGIIACSAVFRQSSPPLGGFLFYRSINTVLRDPDVEIVLDAAL